MSYTICLFEGSSQVNYDAKHIIFSNNDRIAFVQPNDKRVESNCKYVIEHKEIDALEEKPIKEVASPPSSLVTLAGKPGDVIGSGGKEVK